MLPSPLHASHVCQSNGFFLRPVFLSSLHLECIHVHPLRSRTSLRLCFPPVRTLRILVSAACLAAHLMPYQHVRSLVGVVTFLLTACISSPHVQLILKLR
eukprot:678109-Pleurochrysis_carterae.AAC.1